MTTKITCEHGQTNLGSTSCTGKYSLSPRPPQGCGNRIYVIDLTNRGHSPARIVAEWDISTKRAEDCGSIPCADCPARRQL